MQIKIQIGGLALGLLLPLSAAAYFTPQEVLLSEEFFLPPSPRESEERTRKQATRSEDRREFEQAHLENQQVQPVAEETAEEDLKGAAPTSDNLTEEEKELLRAVKLLDAREQRLLDRVQTNQRDLSYYDGRMHGGAPPLAPTGAGGILAAITMLGAVLWTIYAVKKAERGAKAVTSK